MKNSEIEKKHITLVSELLYQAADQVKILSHLAWPLSIREQFFVNKEQQLPRVEYPKFDPTSAMAFLNKARSKLTDSAIDDWLAKKADAIENSISLLCHCGTSDFLQSSERLYGVPKSHLLDETSTSLDLANQFTKILEGVANVDLGAPPAACILASTVADEMAKACQKMFGNAAPPVTVVAQLSANALAGANRIRIRQGACFSDKDVQQLIQHEAYVHVATALNGQQQDVLKFLAINTPASTKTQEGLAVFAELITGCIDLERMQRLADRVIAIQMSIDGADFMEVYGFYCAKMTNKEQAFENTRRVFRGGLLTGGAPFTKDIVYLDGLLRVHNFLRAIVSVGRPDCLRLLFCGKLDLTDIPMLGWMVASGLCKPAVYLPPWATDLRFLLSYLAYSAFLNTIDFSQVKNHYANVLRDVPQIPKPRQY